MMGKMERLEKRFLWKRKRAILHTVNRLWTNSYSKAQIS